MSALRNMCLVCLRTNRKLKTIDTELSEYHDEITDFLLDITKPKYCYECEHLLRKTYNFQKKCKEAASKLAKWRRNKSQDKTPADQLYLALPPTLRQETHLQMWTSDNNKVYTLIHHESPELDIVKEEPDHETVHSESIFKMEVNCKDNQIISESIVDINDEAGNKNTDNKLNKDNESLAVIPENIMITNQNELNHKINTTINKELYVNHLTEFVGVLDQSHTTNDDSGKVNHLPTVKVNMPLVNRDAEILFNYMSRPIVDKPTSGHVTSLKNDKPVISDKTMLTNDITNNSQGNLLSHTVQNKCDDKNIEEGNDSIVVQYNKNDDIYNTSLETVKNQDVLCLDDDKSDDIIVIDDEMNYPSDASLNSDDDCDDWLVPPREKNRKISKLSEKDNDKQKKKNKKEYSDENITSFETNIITKLKHIDESLNDICQNWEVTCLRDIGDSNVTVEYIRNVIRQFLTEKKTNKIHEARKVFLRKRGMDKNLHEMSSDLDFINEKSADIVKHYGTGIHNNPLERLKEELKEKFETWGEMKSEDGFAFDKEIILNCLDKTPEYTVRHLLSLIQGTKSFVPGIGRILKTIQRKHEDSQYEEGFEILRFTSDKEILEEFNRRKTYECYLNANFKCELCYQGFKHERMLEYHKKAHDPSTGALECHICHTRHHNRRRLQKHMSIHTAVYKCKLCPLVTYYRLSMVNHYEQHQGIKYDCEACHVTFKSKSAFIQHNTVVHPRGAHVCTTCGGSFISQQGLQCHVAKKHRGVEPPTEDGEGVKCDTCKLTFPSQEVFLKHERTLHGVRPGYKKRKSPRILKPRKKPIMTCRVCDTIGHSYGWLTLHFKTEHPDVEMAPLYADKQVFLCDVCGKSFSQKYTLREHMGSHKGVTHPCSTCSKRFFSRAALRVHQFTHKPPAFHCDTCGKKFHSYPNLYNHTKTHIGDRRFKCTICGKGFLHRCSLNEHVRGVHNHQRRVRKKLDPRVIETEVIDTLKLGS